MREMDVMTGNKLDRNEHERKQDNDQRREREELQKSMGTSSSFRIGPGDADLVKPTFKVGLLHVRIGWGKHMREMITSPNRADPYDDFGDVDNDLGGVFSFCYTRATYWVYLLSSLMRMRGWRMRSARKEESQQVCCCQGK
jgi:hypothetical protein